MFLKSFLFFFSCLISFQQSRVPSEIHIKREYADVIRRKYFDADFFVAGETKTTVPTTIPGGVSDGQWHVVQLHYYNKVQTFYHLHMFCDFDGPLSVNRALVYADTQICHKIRICQTF